MCCTFFTPPPSSWLFSPPQTYCVVVLEHPEVQDPDLEAVLHTLFKLAARLTKERRDELCGFFEGVGEDRFSRCGCCFFETRECMVWFGMVRRFGVLCTLACVCASLSSRKALRDAPLTSVWLGCFIGKILTA